MTRLSIALLVALLATLALAASATAGGWAVTTLDRALVDPLAGTTYQVGFTIRQHGVHAFQGQGVQVRIRSEATGDWVILPAGAGNAPGHYVAEVTFPNAGAWHWEVVQGPYGPQALGTVDVRNAPATAREAVVDFAALRAVLPAASVLATLLCVLALVDSRRRAADYP